MKWIVISVSALAVSADSFAAGFSLAARGKKLPLVVMAVTFVLCLVTSIAGKTMQGLLDGYADIAGAAILAFVGIVNLFKKDDDGLLVSANDITECIAIGFAVGLDAAVANLSLALQYGDFCVPVIFAVLHYVAVAGGQSLGNKVKIKSTGKLSGMVLIGLAAIKLTQI